MSQTGAAEQSDAFVRQLQEEVKRLRIENQELHQRMAQRIISSAAPSSTPAPLLESRLLENQNLQNLILRQQQLILDNSLTGVAYLIKGGFLWSNKAFQAVLRCTAAELCQIRLRHIFHRQEDFEQIREAMEKEVSGEDSFSGEYRLVDKMGRIFWAFIAGKWVTEPNGEMGTLWQLEDIDYRKKMELDLRVEKEKFRRLSEDSPLGIISCNQLGEILYVNQTMIRLLGSPSREQTKSINLLQFEPLIEAGFSEKLQICLEKQVKVKVKFHYQSIWGKQLDIRAILTPLLGEGEHPNGALIIAEDISDVLKADRKRTNLEKRLHQAKKLEAIGTLAGGIAHDFNNLLYGVKGYIELATLEVSPTSKTQRDLAQAMILAERAEGLIQQILTFSRSVETQKKSRLQLPPIAKEVARYLDSLVPQNVGVTLDLKGLTTEWIMGHPTHIHQLLVNLTTNAGYAMKQKGGVVEISLYSGHWKFPESGERTRPGVAIRVVDSGVGIPEKMMEQVFEPYFTTKPVGEGTGLGLSVVHGIVEEYGGLVKIESQLGKGTIVTVLLPRDS